ncbi:MAG: glucosylceramidase [Clostridia bacterium]|nr:glucosylceramidase [Clostridia bacterium]
MNIKIIETAPKKEIFFNEYSLEYGSAPKATESGVINVYDDVAYQEILGFGAAFTESAAYNYSKLTPEQKKDFLEKHFSKTNGIGYNFGRTHINSCDFSLDIYTYVEKGDKTLETFNIDREKKYVIPFIKDALDYCDNDIFLFSSPWSPPDYMKDNESAIRGGKLKEEYKKVWALYYAKYIKAFLAEGIKISAISVQNEPMAVQPWESCNYSPEDERDFIEQYLAPVFDEEGLSHIKFIIWDHNKERVYDRAKTILGSQKVNERVWAVGHHWYTGDHFNCSTLVNDVLHKPTICTEFCTAITDDLFESANRYAREMCENLNNYTIASCDWNILLSTDGGPYHNRTAESVAVAGKVYESKSGGCSAPVLYDNETKKLVYTPIYYYIGHFSKFIEKGAVRVATTKFADPYYSCAFKNPDGTIVCVILNTTNEITPVTLRHNGICTKIELKPNSIITAIISE